MKVLHLIDSGGFYGAEAVLVELVAEQRRQGMDAIVCSIGLPGEGEKPLERVLRERGLPCWPERMRAGLNFRGAWRILQRARAHGIQLLHSHGYKANILFGFMPRRLRRLPMVSTLHGWTSVGGFSKMRVYEWLDACALGCMDGVALVSEAMRERPELAGRRLPNLRVIPNGISEALPAIDERDPVAAHLRALREHGPLIGSIGRLSPEKGYDVLLRAFARLRARSPQAQLALLGAGGQEPALRAQARALGVEGAVWFGGYVADAGRYLPLLDVYVNSSHTEGLPITLLEAMRAGCPIVASRVGGIPAALGEGRGGRLCPPGRDEALAAGIEAALAEGRASPVVEVARAEFASHYSSRGMAEGYARWYQEALAHAAQ